MYTRILVPVDGSSIATVGLREAIRLARAGNSTIRLVNVVEKLSLDQGLQPVVMIADILRKMEYAGRRVLQAAKAMVENEHLPVQAVQKRPASGNVADEIVREGQRWKADLIVMGAHGLRGAASVLMGTTAQEVIRSARSPVLIVEGIGGSRFKRNPVRPQEALYKRILVPMDGSRTAAAGLREAIKCASGIGECTIRLLHVFEPYPLLRGMDLPITETWLSNRMEFGEKLLKNAKTLVQRQGIRVETVFHKRVQQPAADGITKEIRKWRPDIVVMGTHGRRGISRAVLGSDAESVVRDCSVPVLIVRGR